MHGCFYFLLFQLSVFLYITAFPCLPYVIFAAGPCFIWYFHYISIGSLPLIALTNCHFVSLACLICHFHDICYFRNICYFRYFCYIGAPPCLSLRYCCFCRLLKLYLLFSLYFSFTSVLNRRFGQYSSSALACISEHISDSNGHWSLFGSKVTKKHICVLTLKPTPFLLKRSLKNK